MQVRVYLRAQNGRGGGRWTIQRQNIGNNHGNPLSEQHNYDTCGSLATRPCCRFIAAFAEIVKSDLNVEEHFQYSGEFRQQ